MPDLTRIIDALEALCRAVPGLQGIGVDLRDHGAHITLKPSTDQVVHDLAEMFGLSVHSHKADGAQWFAAYGSHRGRSFSIFGPHHPIVEEATDESEITAALAQADEAVAGG